MMNKINFDDIKRTYELCRHQDITELRFVYPRETKSFFITTFEDLKKICQEYDQKALQYIGMNERVGEGTKHKHVKAVRTQVIDLDYNRPRGTSANDEQVKKTRDLAYNIVKFVEEKGFKRPSIAMSGNGYQLWFNHVEIKINDENRDQIKEQLKLFEEEIRQKFQTTEIKVDSIHDLPRIIKIVGSVSIKGDIHRTSFWEEYNFNSEGDEKLTDYVLNLKKGEKIGDVFDDLRKEFEELEEKEKKPKNEYIDRSVKEFGQVIKLIKKGKTYEEICEEMKVYSKWSSKPESYHLLTYKKALGKIEENKQKKESQTKRKAENGTEYVNLREKIFRLLLNRKIGEATELMVQECTNRFTFVSILNDEKEEIWVYRQGIYLPLGKSIIEIVLREILMEEYSQSFVSIVFSKIYADTKVDMDTFFNKQNETPYLLPVMNGVLDLKTKELKEYNSKYYFFNKLPVYYDIAATCPKYIEFVKSIVGSNTDYFVLQEMFGDCLVKKNKYKKSFMLEGGGDNGKTQILKVLTEYLLGIPNTKAISLSSIEKDQYIVSELQNKLANISGDITDNVLNNTGVFKQLSGGDPVNCSRKFKTSINFVSYATLIFATNDLPIPKDTSEGFWGRWVLIQFPHKFLSQKEYSSLTFEEQQKCKIAIPNIIDSFTKTEMSGVLNWAIEGLNRLMEQNSFSYQNTRKETESVWLTKANSVLAFIKKHVVENYESYISKDEFKKQYLIFCKANNLKKNQIKNDRVIKQTLEEECGAISCQKYEKNDDGFSGSSKKIYVWDGITFKKSWKSWESYKNESGQKSLRENKQNKKSQANQDNQDKSNNIFKPLTINLLREIILPDKPVQFSFKEFEQELRQSYDFTSTQLDNYLSALQHKEALLIVSGDTITKL